MTCYCNWQRIRRIVRTRRYSRAVQGDEEIDGGGEGQRAKRFVYNSDCEMEAAEEEAVGEIGELSEIFQWKGEVPGGLPDWKDEEKKHLGEELSDVLLYLVRLSDVCGIDLGKAALQKMEPSNTLQSFARGPPKSIHRPSPKVEEMFVPTVDPVLWALPVL